MAASGHFEAAKAARATYIVRMDEVAFHVFRDNLRCIGTESLNACTVVTIVSPQAAIFAHVAPNDLSKISTPNTGIEDFGATHMRGKMAEVEQLYHQHSQYFPPGRTTWVVSAIYQGGIALPEQKKIVEETLQRMGLEFTSAVYVVLPAPGIVIPPKGTVFIDARGEKPQVYVEDSCISI